MPMVTATPVSERDDDEVQHRTYFIGLANTANNSYTYPTTQEMLIVRNRSDTESLTLTVNGSNYTIPKGGSKEITTSFTTFSIASTSNSQAFDATAIKAVSSKSSGGTGLLVVANLTELQTTYPNGAIAPVWVTSENSWYYWSGAVPAPDTTPPTVTASLSTGTYVGTQSVTLAANESATIYYTTDGSTPNTDSSVYSSAISVSANTVLKYYGVDTAGNSSAVQTVTYTITQPDTTAPDAPTNFAAGTPTSSTVPLTWTASVASDLSKYEIAYSTDGTNFTVASSNVTGTSATVTGLTANTAYTFRITAIDTSSNRSTPATTTVTTAAAASTNLLSFNGTTTKVAVPSNATLDVTSNFTIEAKVKVTGTGTPNSGFTLIAGKYASTASGGVTTGGFMLCYRGTSFEFNVRNAGSMKQITTAFNPVLNQTYSLKGVLNSGNMEFFVDGVSIGTLAGVTSTSTGTKDFTIGGDWNNTDRLAGVISDVKLSNSSGVKLGEWGLHEGSGTTATDTSGNGFNGTITSGTWITG